MGSCPLERPTGVGTKRQFHDALRQVVIATNAASRLSQTKQSAGNPGRFRLALRLNR